MPDLSQRMVESVLGKEQESVLVAKEAAISKVLQFVQDQDQRRKRKVKRKNLTALKRSSLPRTATQTIVGGSESRFAQPSKRRVEKLW